MRDVVELGAAVDGLPPSVMSAERKRGASGARPDDGTQATGRNYALHRRSVARVIRAMADQIDHSLTTEEMSEIACFSPYHFNRLFRRLTGIPPVQFLYALRLEHAKHLLVTTDLRVTDICFEVGYNSLGTFTSRFNQVVGCSPNLFRRLARDSDHLNLELLCDSLGSFCRVATGQETLSGRLVLPPAFEGVLFVGLFARAIPEGKPESCTLVSGDDRYALPMPGHGRWYVFCFGAPWSTNITQLLTLDDLPRGRSAAILVKNGRFVGDTTVKLAQPDVLNPPMLAAEPLMTAQRRLRAI